MPYLPDTNVWIRHLNPGSSGVKTRLSACSPSQIALCDVVKAELYYGAYKSARQKENLALLETLFLNLRVLRSMAKPRGFSVTSVQPWREKVYPSALTICRSPLSHWPMTASW